MYQLSNFIDNDDIRTLAQLGPFQVIEYQRDLSVSPDSAQTAYFSSVMHVRRRQVLCDLKQANITLQAGAMQWSVGNVNATTGVKGVGDLFGKALRGKVTGESAIKPEYTGDGLLVLEPTYKHILLLDLADWNGSIVLDDGLFLACDARLKHKAVMRSNLSSAVAGNEGLFNLGITGNGVLCLESDCPREELVEQVLSEFQLEILSEEPVEYRCYCSRERVTRALISMGREELNSLIREQGRAELTCQFCDRVQNFTKEDLTAMIADLKKQGK